MAEEFTVVGPMDMAPLWEPVEKHAAALGWAVISWCQLYEELGLLFSNLTTPASGMLAAWHEVKSDRTQRHMLRALVKETLEDKPLVRKYILWALGQLDSMENSRNNAVHAPIDLVLEAAGVTIIPAEATGNPHAIALKDMDLEVEFRRHQENADALKRFIRHLRQLTLEGLPGDPLPEKPRLLSYEQAIAQRQGSKDQPA